MSIRDHRRYNECLRCAEHCRARGNILGFTYWMARATAIELCYAAPEALS